MTPETKTAIQTKILNLLSEDLGYVPLEDSVLLLSELISAIVNASYQPKEVIEEIIPEILPSQALDIVEIAKEPPAIDPLDYSQAEKLEHEATVQIDNMDKCEAKKAFNSKRRKAVAVEEFNDIRGLDNDDLF